MHLSCGLVAPSRNRTNTDQMNMDKRLRAYGLAGCLRNRLGEARSGRCAARPFQTRARQSSAMRLMGSHSATLPGGNHEPLLVENRHTGPAGKPSHGKAGTWNSRQATFWIRLAGPGGTGEVAPRKATSASTSNPGAVARAVPTRRLVNPSPPLARKSFVVTRYDAAGSIGVPFSAMFDTFWPAGCVESYEYVNPAETCRIRCTVWPPKPTNCCSSTFFSCAPVNVWVTTRLLNGWTAKHSPKVTSPGASPAGEFAKINEVRIPPGFIRAICAPAACFVYASCASAITSPSGLSPLGWAACTMSAVMLPTTRLAIGATAVRYLSAIALAAGSTRSGLRMKLPAASLAQLPSGSFTPFSTITLCAAISVNCRVCRSTVTETSVTSRPNELALVTTELAPEELGSAHV